MTQDSNNLKGYVKTSNMYLGLLLALSVGFLGGILFSSYKSTSIAPVSNGAPPPASSTGGVPLTKEQSLKLSALIEATRATPDNVQTWTQLGNFYFDSGKHTKAIEAYEKSLTIDGQRPDVWTDLGVMYRRTGNPKRAIECFDQALSINSKHEVAMFNKGVVFMHDINDTQAALQTWEKLAQINPQAKAPNGQLVSDLVAGFKKNNETK